MSVACRKEITSLIHLGMDDEGLPQHLVAYINDHGHSLTSLFALNKASIPTCSHMKRLNKEFSDIDKIVQEVDHPHNACCIIYK